MKTPIYTVDQKREFAAQMRRKPTLAEAMLWYRLKNRQTGFVFHRQSLQRGYILDFYCPALKLAIEVDGSVHKLKADQDAQKEDALTAWGIKVLRFTNQDVLDFMPVVMARIETTLKAFSSLRGDDGEKTKVDSSSSRACATVQNAEPVRRDEWKGLREILNRSENLCRPQQMPDDQHISRETAEEVARACKRLVTCTKQRAIAFEEDNRTMAERAFDQRYRLQEWLKRKRPQDQTDPATLMLQGMHITDPLKRKA